MGLNFEMIVQRKEGAALRRVRKVELKRVDLRFEDTSGVCTDDDDDFAVGALLN